MSRMNFGITEEDIIVAKLSAKCGIERDQEIDHVYSLDLIINKINAIAKRCHIGIQLTTNPTDNGKKARFVFTRKKKEVVDRSLYVIVNADVNLDAYGIELLYTAIVHFAFSQEMAEKDIMGLTIGPGVTYRFFDIEQDVENARIEPELPFDHPQQPTTAPAEKQADTPPRQAPEMDRPERKPRFRGVIKNYFPDKGFGFIRASRHEGTRDEWYFHVTNCHDSLHDEIKKRMTTGRFSGMEVIFIDAGYLRKDAPAPSAVEISLHTSKEGRTD